VPQMAAAGKELSDVVRNEIVGKGAKYVVLVNLPDLASSPSAKSQSASSQQLIAGMVNGFNIALRVGIDGLESKVLPVDLFTVTQLQAANGTAYGYSNTTTPACGNNALGGTSLVCNASNVIAGDVSKYMWADTVHPTPYANELIAQYVASEMKKRGWL
jgi:outer membrane lipase/esterase